MWHHHQSKLRCLGLQKSPSLFMRINSGYLSPVGLQCGSRCGDTPLVSQCGAGDLNYSAIVSKCYAFISIYTIVISEIT